MLTKLISPWFPTKSVHPQITNTLQLIHGCFCDYQSSWLLSRDHGSQCKTNVNKWNCELNTPKVRRIHKSECYFKTCLLSSKLIEHCYLLQILISGTAQCQLSSPLFCWCVVFSAMLMQGQMQLRKKERNGIQNMTRNSSLNAQVICPQNNNIVFSLNNAIEYELFWNIFESEEGL